MLLEIQGSNNFYHIFPNKVRAIHLDLKKNDKKYFEKFTELNPLIGNIPIDETL